MYVHNIDAIVYTLPPMNFKEFVQQRIRWAAKSKFYSDIEIIIMAMLVFFTCTSLTIILIKSFFNHSLFILYLIGLFIKSIPDYLILQKITSDYKLKNLMKWFIPTQLFYPFYVIIIGIYSIFGKFNWKNRNFNARKQHKHLENNS